MAKLNVFNIIMIITCALSACSMRATQDSSWYEVTKLLPWYVEHGKRGHSGFWGSYKPFEGAAVLGNIGKEIRGGYEKIRTAIENMTPEYVRGVQKGELLMKRYNPTHHYGGAEMSDFEVLARALKGTYGSALQELAQQKENQLALALAGEGLTQAAETQIKSSWSNIGNFGKNQLKHRLGSIWSNYARPGIEYIGSASRYLVPTGISQYAQTFPAVQRFTSLPRETQNLALGIAAPTAVLAAYTLLPKAYRGAQNLYQQWNAQPGETLDQQIERLKAKQQESAKQASSVENIAKGGWFSGWSPSSWWYGSSSSTQ